MLARPEWNEPEKREPVFPREAEVSFKQAFAAALFVSISVWAFLIMPILNWLNQVSVAHYVALYTLK